MTVAALISFVRKHSPFYGELYSHLPAGVSALTDLPVLDQQAFWQANDLQENRLLTGPMHDGIILKSGGTTGKPKFSVFSRSEWAEFTATFAAKLAHSGLQDGDRVANLFYVGELYGSFIFTHKVLEDCPVRLLQLPIGGAASPASVIQIIKDYRATALAGLPTTILSLVDANPGPTDIKTILFAGEPMQAAQRARVLEGFPGAHISSIGYASTDAGLLGYADLSCGPNEFRCYDSEAIFEILDEETQAPISASGIAGKAIITSLKRRLMPIIRYPAGDRAQWIDPPGTAMRKFRLLGRSNESARVGPVTVYFEDVRSVLQNFINQLGVYQFQLIVNHHARCDGLILRIGCAATQEARDACQPGILAAFYASRPMYRELAEAAKIHPLQIEWRERHELEINARTGKLKTLIDQRGL